MNIKNYYEYDTISNVTVKCLQGGMISAGGNKIEVSESQMKYFQSKPIETVYDLDVYKKMNIEDEVLERKLHFYMEKPRGKFTDNIKNEQKELFPVPLFEIMTDENDFIGKYCFCWYPKNKSMGGELELYYCKVIEKISDQYVKAILYFGNTFNPKKVKGVFSDVCIGDLSIIKNNEFYEKKGN